MATFANFIGDHTVEFNRTDEDFPTDVTLHELFEYQACIHGPRIAVLCEHDNYWGTSHLTFAQLNEKANQVARRLQQEGVQPGQIVGILAERSFAMIIGLLGILKTGAAYLPLSPDDPVDRLAYVLTDAGVKILLVHGATKAKAPSGPATIDLESPSTYTGSTANLGVTSGAEDLAYVIYTSGSTGRPKGVMIEHRSVVNRLDWMQRAYPIDEGDVLLQKTSYCFDVSVWELFWWATEGATLSLLRPRGERSPQVLLEAVQRDRVSMLHFVPSMLNVFLEYLAGHPDKVATALPSLRRVFASGEALSAAHVQKFNEIVGRVTGCALTNLYGPTEATVDATYFDCPADGEIERVPIGRPIQNLRAYIVRDEMLAPIGEVGELCLAGVGLARGYLNNPQLTHEKFIESPAVSGQRIYRTGDLARWLPDGNIEYLGREDNQVKIRGLRIELGEIENNLRQFPGVADCLVVVQKHSESIILIVASYVAREEIAAAELKKHLQARLPDYMVPARFERIARIPLTANGKADRKALPEALVLKKAG